MDRRQFLAAGVFSLGACNRKASLEPINVRMAVVAPQAIYNLPLILAEHLGFYREAGLQVEIQELPFGTKSVTSLVEGKADIACNYFSYVVAHDGVGKNLRGFINLLRYPGLAVVTSPKTGGDLKRLGQIRHRPIGIVEKDTASQYILNYLLSKHGVEQEAAKIIALDTVPRLTTALETGEVHAAMLAEPLITELEQRYNKLSILVDLRTELGVRQTFETAEYPGAVVYAQNAWLQENPEACLRLAKAFRRTLAWISTHNTRDIAAKMPAAYRIPDNLTYTDALVTTIPIFSGNGELDEESMTVVLRVLEHTHPEMKDSPLTFEDMFTNKFVLEAEIAGS